MTGLGRGFISIYKEDGFVKEGVDNLSGKDEAIKLVLEGISVDYPLLVECLLLGVGKFGPNFIL